MNSLVPLDNTLIGDDGSTRAVTVSVCKLVSDGSLVKAFVSCKVTRVSFEVPYFKLDVPTRVRVHDVYGKKAKEPPGCYECPPTAIGACAIDGWAVTGSSNIMMTVRPDSFENGQRLLRGLRVLSVYAMHSRHTVKWNK